MVVPKFMKIDFFLNFNGSKLPAPGTASPETPEESETALKYSLPCVKIERKARKKMSYN